MNALVGKQKQALDFSIPAYLLCWVLPKCSLVYGESISTVYLQIAANINYSQKKMQQFKDYCWMHTRTIAKKTGYNERTIQKVLKILQELKMIKSGNVGKIKAYQLRNHKIVEEQDIFSFLHFIENKLLSKLPEEEEKNSREKFKEMNNYFLNKKIIPKLTLFLGKQEDMKNNLIQAENTYKGSSLFYLSLLAENKLFKKNNLLSEHERAMLLGTSQSTLSRYINSYEKCGIIVREQKSKRFFLGLVKKKQPFFNNIKER